MLRISLNQLSVFINRLIVLQEVAKTNTSFLACQAQYTS